MKKRKELPVAALRRLVVARASQRCEYCHAPQQVSGHRFHIDHIVPTAHGGSHREPNRALACAACNLAKIDRMYGIDPETGGRTPLFHPRRQTWDDHFEWQGETLCGRTAEGRVTVVVLDMNSEMRLGARELWFATGWLP